MRMITVAAGFLAAVALTSFPASAADAVIAAQNTNSWSQTAVTINVGDSVTWTNAGGTHNVCVQKPGTSGDACDEYTNGPVDNAWTSVSHTFLTPGTYAFFCAAHRSVGMTGTITVAGGSTTPGTTPTQTESQPAPAPTPIAPADTTAPGFTGKVKRRASRKSLTLEFVSTEAGRLNASVYRRRPHGHTFSRVSQASLNVKLGKNVVTLLRKPRGSLRNGSYKVKLQLVDAAGNKSGMKTLTFKLV